MIDFLAFQPKVCFSVAMPIFLTELEKAGQTKVVRFPKEENRVKSQFQLGITEQGESSAKWKSSYEDIDPFCTTYASNTVEAGWRCDHVVHGKTKSK